MGVVLGRLWAGPMQGRPLGGGPGQAVGGAKTELGAGRGRGEDLAGVGAVEVAGRDLGSRGCVAAELLDRPSLPAFRGN